MNFKKMFKKWDDTSVNATNFNGVWRNELNSEMSITVDELGRISGEYCPNRGSASSDNIHRLVGFANGNLVSFTVDFGHQHMVCSWTGHSAVELNTDVIKTQWNLVKNNGSEEFSMETWGATHCGSNTFKRVG